MLDEALGGAKPGGKPRGYIAGSYSIADMALYPWVAYHQWAGVTLEGLPHLQAWRDRVGARPGVQQGLEYNKKDVNTMLADAQAIREKVAATTLDRT